MSRSRLLRGLRPMHPGEMLREDVLPALGKSRAEIARLLGISRQTLYDIIAEKQPVTPGIALRLGKLCGNGPDLWINLQRAYDLVIAERELSGRDQEHPNAYRRVNCVASCAWGHSQRYASFAALETENHSPVPANDYGPEALPVTSHWMQTEAWGASMSSGAAEGPPFKSLRCNRNGSHSATQADRGHRPARRLGR
jgi:addiction module HigA family antidote